MKILQILATIGFAAVIASPLAAAPRKHQSFAAPEANYANPALLDARAQAPGISAPYATGDYYVGTDPDPSIRSELHRDPAAARQ
jgi:hypothetical protein